MEKLVSCIPQSYFTQGLIEWGESVYEPTEKGKQRANLEEIEVETFFKTRIKVLSVARKAWEWLVGR